MMGVRWYDDPQAGLGSAWGSREVGLVDDISTDLSVSDRQVRWLLAGGVVGVGAGMVFVAGCVWLGLKVSGLA